MSAFTRAFLGPVAGALVLAFACSEPSKPDEGWIGEDDPGSGQGGEPANPEGGASSKAGGSGAPASGTSSGGTLSAGAAGSASSPGGKSTSGGKAGSAGASGGSGGKGGAGAAATAGKGGSSSAGRAGAQNSAGDPGSAGETGSGGEGSPTGDFFGESRCSTDFDFCDDFEGGLKSDYSTQGTVPTFDATRFARGAKSAHFTATGNGLSVLRYAFPAREKYYARMFVYFEALPTAPKYAHWSIAGATGDGTEAEIRVGGQFDGTTNRFGVGTDHGETGDWTRLSEEQDEVPEGKWICVEWLHDGAANESRFWSDGMEHASLHTTATDHDGEDGTYDLPEFTEVFIGWWHYQMDSTPSRFNVWIDEFAIDGDRIGCTR